MIINNKLLKKGNSRNTHRFLIKECFRIMEDRGYEVLIEHKLKKGVVADLYVTKGKEKVIVECLVRPTLTRVKEKVKKYFGLGTKLIISYPSHFIPTFPIENYAEIMTLDVPERLKLEEPNLTMVEIYHDDKKDLHICKIMSNAKNLPDVLHDAIKQLKKEIENAN